MVSSHGQSRLPLRGALAIAAVASSLMLHPPTAAQQPCNPVIDGTYCATQMPRMRMSEPSRLQLQPIQDLGSALSTSSIGQDTPGTLGGISFRGGSTCIGLLRRGACN